MAEIQMNRIRKEFGAVVAVEDITLMVNEGEFLVFVGPSGCGKTTTLRMIAGLESVTSGDIYIGGRRVNDLSPGDRDVAMVFQNYALYSHLSVRNNLSFALKARRVARKEIEQRVNNVAEMLELVGLLDRKPSQLSGGQRQRVALGRAIIREPQAFLMDEPLSNLDALLRLQTRRELIELTRELDSTVVYVTHDQVEAMTMGHRLAVMRDGRVEQLDTPDRIFHKPANRFVAQFIGSPPMNFLPVRVAGSGSERTLKGDVVRCMAPPGLDLTDGAPVTLGIRPQDVKLTADNSFPVNVSVIERLGSEKLVHCDAGSDTLSLLVPASEVITINTQIHVQIEADKIHLFDRSSGLRIKT